MKCPPIELLNEAGVWVCWHSGRVMTPHLRRDWLRIWFGLSEMMSRSSGGFARSAPVNPIRVDADGIGSPNDFSTNGVEIYNRILAGNKTDLNSTKELPKIDRKSIRNQTDNKQSISKLTTRISRRIPTFNSNIPSTIQPIKLQLNFESNSCESVCPSCTSSVSNRNSGHIIRSS